MEEINFLWKPSKQFVIFKPLSYCFEETIGFDVKASFASRPVSRLIRWCNKPSDIIKKFWEKAIQFHGTFHRLKITNWKMKKEDTNGKTGFNANANAGNLVITSWITCKKISLLNSAWLWSRARLAINKKQKYFSLPDHQLAENLTLVFGLQERTKRG